MLNCCFLCNTVTTGDDACHFSRQIAANHGFLLGRKEVFFAGVSENGRAFTGGDDRARRRLFRNRRRYSSVRRLAAALDGEGAARGGTASAEWRAGALSGDGGQGGPAARRVFACGETEQGRPADHQ